MACGRTPKKPFRVSRGVWFEFSFQRMLGVLTLESSVIDRPCARTLVRFSPIHFSSLLPLLLILSCWIRPTINTGLECHFLSFYVLLAAEACLSNNQSVQHRVKCLPLRRAAWPNSGVARAHTPTAEIPPSVLTWTRRAPCLTKDTYWKTLCVQPDKQSRELK